MRNPTKIRVNTIPTTIPICNPFILILLRYNHTMATIKLSKKNFYHNLNQITLQTGSVEKIAIVLKDNAYGHGLVEMARLACEYGITKAVVGTTQEAEAISAFFTEVVVLGDTPQVEGGFTYVLNALEAIASVPFGVKVELKVDTGMHRNGIELHQLEEALFRIQERGLLLQGVMTHYRSADVLSSEFFWQQKRFEVVKQRVKEAGVEGVRFHSHNSASILRTHHFSEDFVRVGIGAYGYSELPPLFNVVKLKPVLSLWAKRMATRHLKKGQRVGYGGDFIAPKDMVVSTYDVGYGDGLMRGLFEGKFLTPSGHQLLGRISMDFVTFEGEEEEVCLFENAQEVAEVLGTISYEVLTQLHPSVKREVVEE
jgi:alanine racemase